MEDIFIDISKIINSIQLKDKLKQVFVFLPDFGISDSCNRFLLEQNKALINVRTGIAFHLFFPLINDYCETNLKNYFNEFQVRNLFYVLLQNQSLNHFKSIDEFSSVRRFLYKSIRELRLNLKSSDYKNAIQDIPSSGKEILTLLQGLENSLNPNLDYCRALELLPEFIKDKKLPDVILYPGLKENLPGREARLLEGFACHFVKLKDKTVKISKEQNALIEIKSSYNEKQEIKDTFREILKLNDALENSVVIVPHSYLDLTLELAMQFKIPYRTDFSGSDSQCVFKIFQTVLDILESDFDYKHIRLFLLLQNRNGQLKRLAKTNIPGGFKSILNIIQENIKKNQEYNNENKVITQINKKNFKSSDETLLETLKKIKSFENLKNNPQSLGLKIIEDILPNSLEKNLLSNIIKQNTWLSSCKDFSIWSREIRQILENTNSSANEDLQSEYGLYITTNLMPGLFNNIFMPGLYEGSFPPVFREDPILTDPERDRINKNFDCRLPDRKDRIADFETRFWNTLFSAKKLWCGSYAKYGQLNNKQHTPTFYLIELARKINKAKMNLEQYNKLLQKNNRPAWFQNQQALDNNEWILQNLIAPEGSKINDSEFINHIINQQKSVHSHLLSDRETWSPKIGPYTGYTGIDLFKIYGNSFSATKIGSILSCPRNWFLSSFLKLKKFEEPAPVRKLEAMHKGTIIHEIFENYFNTKSGKVDLDKLKAMSRKYIDDWSRAHGGMPDLFIDIELKSIEAHLIHFLEFQNNLEIGRKPKHFEYAFGRQQYSKDSEIQNSFALQFGEFNIELNGFIDRIDLAKTTAWILDYKTGKDDDAKEYMKDTHIAHFIQAGLYAAVVEKKFPNIKNIQTGYFYTLNKSEETIREYDDQMKSELHQAVEHIVKSLKSGLHFANPGKCDYCDHSAYCGKLIDWSAQKQLHWDSHPAAIQTLLDEHEAIMGDSNDQAE